MCRVSYLVKVKTQTVLHLDPTFQRAKNRTPPRMGVAVIVEFRGPPPSSRHDMATPGLDRPDPTALVHSPQTGGETVWSARICLDENFVGGVNNTVRSSRFYLLVWSLNHEVAAGVELISVVNLAWSRG